MKNSFKKGEREADKWNFNTLLQENKALTEQVEKLKNAMGLEIYWKDQYDRLKNDVESLKGDIDALAKFNDDQAKSAAKQFVEMRTQIEKHVREVVEGPFYGITKDEYHLGRYHAIDFELDFYQFLLSKFPEVPNE